jgi:hypothetical protein
MNVFTGEYPSGCEVESLPSGDTFYHGEAPTEAEPREKPTHERPAAHCTPYQIKHQLCE